MAIFSDKSVSEDEEEQVSDAENGDGPKGEEHNKEKEARGTRNPQCSEETN